MPAPKGHAPYPGCETGGAPKIYTNEFIENEADAFLKWVKKHNNIYFKRFAVERGYHPQRLSEWAKENKKFSDAYELAQAWHEIKLVEGALTSDLNPGFTKFVLTNTCGWSEKAEATTTNNHTYLVNYGNPEQFLPPKLPNSNPEGAG